MSVPAVRSPRAGTRRRGARASAAATINEACGARARRRRARAFVKTRADAAPGEYATEAAGLRWLARAGAVARARGAASATATGRASWRSSGSTPGRLDAAGEEALGRGLAALHAAGRAGVRRAAARRARRRRALRIGELALPNDPRADWPAFYAERRLRAARRAAPERGTLSASGARAVERVCERIADLAGPAEPPARLHGDLWGGNVLAGADGRARLIDPAAYGGHREVDLAMLRLFGAPSERVLRRLRRGRAAGRRPRASASALWQLFPLLVHAALFGGSLRRVGRARGRALRHVTAA